MRQVLVGYCCRVWVVVPGPPASWLTRRLLLACRAGSAAVGDNDEAIADANAVATDESQAKSTQYATSNFPLP
jgi:hypothetical protein